LKQTILHSFEKSVFATSKGVLNHGLPYSIGSQLKTIQYYLIVTIGFMNDYECYKAGYVVLTLHVQQFKSSVLESAIGNIIYIFVAPFLFMFQVL